MAEQKYRRSVADDTEYGKFNPTKFVIEISQSEIIVTALSPKGIIVGDGDSDNIYSLSSINFETAPATFTMTVNYTNPGGGTRAGGNGTYVFNMQAQ